MNAANQLLDKAKEHSSIASDNALAARLGITRQTVSKWRLGESPIADDRIAQLAHLAGDDVGKWLVLIHGDTATGELAREWAKLAKRLGAVAATLAVAALPLLPGKAEAARLSAALDAHHLYIMSQLRRRLRAIAAAVDRWRWRHGVCRLRLRHEPRTQRGTRHVSELLRV